MRPITNTTDEQLDQRLQLMTPRRLEQVHDSARQIATLLRAVYRTKCLPMRSGFLRRNRYKGIRPLTWQLFIRFAEREQYFSSNYTERALQVLLPYGLTEPEALNAVINFEMMAHENVSEPIGYMKQEHKPRALVLPSIPVKRKPGRPKGAKNKRKKVPYEYNQA